RRSFARGGRTAAYVSAGCYVLASLIFILITKELLGPEDKGAAAGSSALQNLGAFFRFVHDRWPYDLIISVLFSVGILALIPLGISLRELAGRRTLRNDLMAATLTAGAVLGAASQMLILAGRDLVAHEGVCACKNALLEMASLNASRIGIEEYGGKWLGLAFFVLVGIGVYLASLDAGRWLSFDSRWVQLGMVVAGLYLVGVVASLFGMQGLFELVVGIGGGILAPAWAFWLGKQLPVGDSVGSGAVSAAP
ncbi:MAG: hypothetical protein QOH90_453, partial [Actinomycetota bacterium]|nr:hypothetical protein [Actinomycetota bacterium]